jgi:hypothetical protein
MKKQQLLASSRRLANNCLSSCRRILEQLQNVKNSILEDFRGTVDSHLLKLALNEAEATALQTQFPQLLFPALAQEKAQSVRDWQLRQEFLSRRQSFSGMSVRLHGGSDGR